MSSLSFLSRVGFGSLLVLVLTPSFPATAADGTFNVPTTTGTYDWSNSANWASGGVADGSGFTATFGNITGNTTNFTIAVDTIRTIGNLSFFAASTADTHNFTIAGPQILTLEGTAAPNITVDLPTRTATISATLAGTQGFNLFGDLTLSGSNTLAGTINVGDGTGANASTLTIKNASALGATGALNSTVVKANNSLVLDNVTVTNETLSLGGSGNGGNTGSLQGKGNAAWTGNIALTAAARIGTVDATSQLTISGVISGSQSLSFSGLGTTVLSGANTFNGTTTIFRGTLKLDGGDNRLATGQTLSLGQTADNATFDLNGRNQRVTGLVNIDTQNSTRTITNSSGTASVLTLNTTTLSTSFLGDAGDVTQITGNLSIVKDGAAFAQTLAKTNSYTGNTTVTAGTLILADDATMKFYIGANGVNNQINGAGTMTLNGDFIFDLTGAAAVDGNSWNLVNVGTLSETFGGTFTVQGFVNNAGLWTSGGYQFSQATGVLSYSAIPEPATFGMMVLGLGGCILLRRFRCSRSH